MISKLAISALIQTLYALKAAQNLAYDFKNKASYTTIDVYSI